ncbi:nucleocapsid [Ferak virus]|uniref:Nucleocapsid n=1 Tax=Ferak virus TaxID=1664810 RepID=A0A0H4B8U5_9VIRU|nr:nucleocapsid [Ferak virus]AKN56892.1 nucleocapsid [Ferak virus]AKN56912.1 nucleocapsid [Ferak virus]AKN56917.1 nucleocapsid [Ferak virus]
MTSSTVLKPDSFRQITVPIEDSWPAAMLRTSAELVVVDKADIYVKLMSQLDENVSMSTIDNTMTLINTRKPTAAMAFATYCTSTLWAENVRNSRGLAAFNLKVADTSIPIYSMKGENNTRLDKNMFSVDDAIHCSTLYMNKIVDDFYLKMDKTWAMTPLARICMTDSNIKALSDEMNVDESVVVKTLNVSCCRKAYQLYGVTKYCSLEAVVAGIMRTSFAPNASATTKSIAAKNISKCANKAGVGGIDTKKVSTILSYMVGSNSGMNMEVDNLMEMAKRMAKERSANLATSSSAQSAFSAITGTSG